MSAHPQTHGVAAPTDLTTLLSAAGWPCLADRILAGGCHDLNGRASALYGLAELARAGEEENFLNEALSTEAKRIQTLAASLRTLSDRAPDDPRPISIREELGPAAALFSLQPGGERFRLDIQADPATPAAFAPSRSLTRAILLALNVVAANVLRTHSSGTLRLTAAPAEGRPGLMIEGRGRASAHGADPGSRELRERFGEWPVELSDAFEGLGAEVHFQGGVPSEGAGPQVEVRLSRPPE
ncbi:MAG: hypothetical protein HKO53_03045 [Gemmatimonadetes bacterium]|nr:hypothetical protein [Gemmatimonadota bacterium]NNM32011.1 hypothetical protein [Gemmatimonadota bacterium]